MGRELHGANVMFFEFKHLPKLKQNPGYLQLEMKTGS